MLTSKGGLRDATGYAKPTQNLSTPRLECWIKRVLGRVFVFVRQTDRKGLWYKCPMVTFWETLGRTLDAGATARRATLPPAIQYVCCKLTRAVSSVVERLVYTQFQELFLPSAFSLRDSLKMRFSEGKQRSKRAIPHASHAIPKLNDQYQMWVTMTFGSEREPLYAHARAMRHRCCSRRDAAG